DGGERDGDEVLGHLLFCSAFPAGVTTHHGAPKPVLPSPVVWPARESPANVYSGWPAYVASSEPSARFVVPSSEALTAPLALGVPVIVRGGHACAQAPVHVLAEP